ncbi:MAG: PAS domain-containing protein, partial [Marmoricola sp.]
MNSTSQMAQLRGLASALADEHTPERLLAVALPAIASIATAETAMVLAQTADGPRVTARVGLELEVQHAEKCLEAAEKRLADDPVPQAWAAKGIRRLSSHRLPAHAGVLVLAWATEMDDAAEAPLELALASLQSHLVRAQAEEDLADLVTRVDSAQQLAGMGDYDWHITTDVNTWSDQLFRIYGHEPQSFHPSYETFLSMIHPDDRERIAALHQQAYATGEPYQMIERIVRPTGEVRYLSSNGEVIMHPETQQPVRMRGTCIDITERVLADRERERSAARFQGLVDSAPDAILVLDEAHRVVEANQRAHELLGGDPQNHSIDEIVPGWPSRGTVGVDATSLDGHALQLDVITVGMSPASETDTEDHSLIAVFLRDAHPRLEGEAVAARLGEARLRRRQALEINDNVVQGLVAAVYSLDQGEVEGTLSYLDRTLTAARAMMDDLLDPLDGLGLQPGDLVRTSPAVIGMDPEKTYTGQEQVMELQRSHSVLVVDDAEDLRTLLRARMEAYRGLTVVGEAADGVAAVELASELQPDLVLLDLAMPRMDGLEALPLIRA